VLSIEITVHQEARSCQERCSHLLTVLSPTGTMAGVNAPRTARARARAELTAAIKDVARRHLAEHGSAGLSLRAVARELDMASSALYRYFASRDDLLTALIIDAYDSLGAAAERADAGHEPADDVVGRWLATCRTVRRWALRHPHEYALIYGSPVPGYVAPRDTVGPATRVPTVLAAQVRRAVAAGTLRPARPGRPTAPPEVLADAEAVVDPLFEGVPPEVVVRSIIAWTSLFGLVSFELFGQYDNVVAHRDAWFDHACRLLAAEVGLPL
jgi:AcrR family transcriptional regulator